MDGKVNSLTMGIDTKKDQKREVGEGKGSSLDPVGPTSPAKAVKTGGDVLISMPHRLLIEIWGGGLLAIRKLSPW